MNSKLLETLIKQGHQVAVKSNDGRRKVFLFILGDGIFQGTGIISNIDECFAYGLNNSHFSKEEIENEFTDEYKVVTPAPLTLEVGDEVEILENVRKFLISNGRSDEHIRYVGERGKIFCLGTGAYCVEFVNGCFFHFPNRAVAKVEKQQEETDILVKGGKTYKVQIIEEIVE